MFEERSKMPGMGWVPDLPDFRDYRFDHDAISTKNMRFGQDITVKGMLGEVGVVEDDAVTVRGKIDLRRWCSPIENQLSLGSCTAQAAAAVVEYFEKRAFGKHIDASRLFLYKVSRNLLHWTGDTGAYLRTAMGALVLFGVPPEEYWPYNIADFEVEPPAFCYSYAQNFQAINYYRLDYPGITRNNLLRRIKVNLLGGLPSMFGFTVFSSISQAADDGKIPFPTNKERRLGGHAVVAVGYDDDVKIENEIDGGPKTKGALLIRNSWGPHWGDNGYGWLPYDFVLRGLAIDWWSLLKQEWIETGVFKISN